MVPVHANVSLLSPNALIPHPDNPRGKLEKKDVDELLPLIEQHGQQQPCVVREHPTQATKYQVVIGHRRALVGRLLEREVPCLVVPMTDEQALAVMLADNPSHVAPDPLRESEAVATFLARPNMNLRAVADLLGKTPRWVAQRANLQNLAPEVRRDAQSERSEVSRWPVAWLERLATLSHTDQVALLEQVADDYEPVSSLKELETVVAEFTNKLSAAPWALDDATLLPEAGPCTTCPKQSGCKPGLFDDGAADADPKKSTCLDLSCWRKKLAASASIQVKALRKEHPNMVAVEGANAYDDQKENHLRASGLKKLRSYDFTPAKKGEKGAVPALIYAGEGKGNVRWVKVKRTTHTTSGGTPVTPEQKAKIEAEKLVAQRTRHACAALGKLIEKSTVSDVDNGGAVVLAVVRLFGSGEGQLVEEYVEAKRKKLVAAAAKDIGDARGETRRLWEYSRRFVAQAFSNEYGYPNLDEGRLVADLLGIDFAALEAAALKAVPDPKPVGEITQKTTPKSKSKGKKKARAAAAV